MKRKLLIIIIIPFCVFLLGACSDNNNNGLNDENIPDPKEQSDNSNELNNEENNAVNNTSNNLANNNNSEEGNSTFKVETEDQLDLRIGDIGKFDTTLGTFEITLDAAKLVGEELDGEPTQLENLLLLDITLKNTSDKTLLVEELIGSMIVSHEIDRTGSPDGAEYFESLEKFIGEIEPNEVRSGQLIMDVNNQDKYYFREDSGLVAAGLTNQVIWTITKQEAQ